MTSTSAIPLIPEPPIPTKWSLLALRNTGTLSVRGEPGEQRLEVIHHHAADFSAVYTLVDGYMVMAPHKALVDLALQYRSSGVNLASSTDFLALLPNNGYTDCSALLYRNLAELADAVPDGVILPPDAMSLIEQSAEASLVCVIGEEDRILVSGIGESLIGSAPMLGISGLIMGDSNPHSTTRSRVSSTG